MRSFSISFIVAAVSFLGTGQVAFNKVKHDFGELESYSVRYVDIIVSNKSHKQEWILSIKKPMEVVYITTKQILEKDSSIIIRFQVNPKEQGRFSYEVRVFTSDREEATKIKLLGSLENDPNDGTTSFTGCPDFSSRPGGQNPNKFDLTVVTIDKITRDELANSNVTMIQNGRPVWVKTTNKKGKIKEDATLGLSYFYATHDGYFPAELGAYVNFKRNYIVVELGKDDRIAETTLPVFDSSIISTTDLEIIVEIETHLEQELKPDFDTTAIAELPSSFAELDKENFDAAHFKPVNVVFVLDVSSSMKQVDKIELMKYSLFQLTDMLRPQDKIGIVTYASDARVLLNSTSGDQKQRIKKEVSELKAFGYTAGGSGIKLGFRQAKRAMIPNGKNQVIVITDGAFNRNSEDYKKYVKKYLKKGIHMSVVGVKNKSVDEQKMRNAAELGGGHYVPIMKLSDAQHNLKQEIRMLAYKY